MTRRMKKENSAGSAEKENSAGAAEKENSAGATEKENWAYHFLGGEHVLALNLKVLDITNDDGGMDE